MRQPSVGQQLAYSTDAWKAYRTAAALGSYQEVANSAHAASSVHPLLMNSVLKHVHWLGTSVLAEKPTSEEIKKSKIKHEKVWRTAPSLRGQTVTYRPNYATTKNGSYFCELWYSLQHDGGFKKLNSKIKQSFYVNRNSHPQHLDSIPESIPVAGTFETQFPDELLDSLLSTHELDNLAFAPVNKFEDTQSSTLTVSLRVAHSVSWTAYCTFVELPTAHNMEL